MANLQQSATHFADTKPHYALLDGLRGVAALLVVWYHVFEGYQFASGSAIIQEINHGYLAVDFFFILSGFVIGYAYDDRWGKTLTLGKFFKRRLIRLHPMVVNGCLDRTRNVHPSGSRNLERHTGFGTCDDDSPALRHADDSRPARWQIRGKRQWRNVSAQRPRLVALLRVHRQHPLCSFHSEALHQGSGYSRRNPIHPAALVHGYGCMRIWHVWCGLDAR